MFGNLHQKIDSDSFSKPNLTRSNNNSYMCSYFTEAWIQFEIDTDLYTI